MPRPQRCRRICGEPEYDRFAPSGIAQGGPIRLSLDEYEAIRLVDLLGNTHEPVSYTHLLDTDLDADTDADSDSDSDSGDHGSDLELRIFTLRGFVAFFAIFGWSGLSMLRNGIQPALSIILAFLLGVIAMVITALITRSFLRLQDVYKRQDMHIKTLRQKLGSCGGLIQTVRGIGYKLGEGKA